MSSTNTGGPAFPHPGRTITNPGMTLRDYFAAKVMMGIISCPVIKLKGDDAYAKAAYEMADAMLKAREEK